MEIIKINENSWRIEDGGVRFFVLEGNQRAAIIDTGMNLENVKEVVESITSLPYILINPHADRDHVHGNKEFDSFYMHPAEESLYRSSGKPGKIIPVQEGDVIDLGDRELKIIDLPGHTPGSIAVLDAAARVLISGDPIQRHGRIFMFGPHRNMDMYIESMEQLEKRKSEFDEIWPSHADIPVNTDTIKLLHDGAQDILAGKVTGNPEEMFGNSIAAYDLGFCTILCDR